MSVPDRLTDEEKAALAECVAGFAHYAWARDGNHSTAAAKRAHRTALIAANVVRRWKPLATPEPPERALVLAVERSRFTPHALTPEPLTMPVPSQDPPVPLDAARLREQLDDRLDLLRDYRRISHTADGYQQRCDGANHAWGVEAEILAMFDALLAELRAERDECAALVAHRDSLLSRLAQSEGDAATMRKLIRRSTRLGRSGEPERYGGCLPECGGEGLVPGPLAYFEVRLKLLPARTVDEAIDNALRAATDAT